MSKPDYDIYTFQYQSRIWHLYVYGNTYDASPKTFRTNFRIPWKYYL